MSNADEMVQTTFAEWLLAISFEAAFDDVLAGLTEEDYMAMAAAFE